MFETITYGDHADQFGHLGKPEGHAGRPLVVLIHGGFWRDRYRLDLMDPLARDLNRLGYATWNIEYRRVGPSGGNWLNTPADVAKAIDTMAGGWKSHCVIGHSAGGHLALWNAGRRQVHGSLALTVGLAPVVDVCAANRDGVGDDATANFVGGSVEDFPHRYAHVQPRVDKFVGKVVLVHGTNDENVPISQSRQAAWAVDEVHLLEGVDHFDVIDDNHDSWRLVCETLNQLG